MKSPRVRLLAIFEAGTLSGDFDLDDDVDGRDFLVWQRSIGSTTRTVADASLNGVVDSADLAIWQEHYGERFGSSASIAVQVPESPTLAFAMIIFTLVSARGARPPMNQ